MNEAALVRKIIPAIEKKLPGAVIYKLNDLSTAGVPDLVVNYRRSHWFEAKCFSTIDPPASLVKKKFDKLQLAQMLRLDSSLVPAAYLVGFNDGGLCVMLPLQVEHLLLYGDWSWERYEAFDRTIDYLAERIKR